MYGFVSQYAMLNLFPLLFYFGVAMIVFDVMENQAAWLAFYRHKTRNKEDANARYDDLLGFIESKKYLVYVDALKRGDGISAPQKLLINKSGSGKKRTVYCYTEEENYILGMIAFLLKQYDDIFAPNLYSFRVQKTAKTAFQKFRKLLQNKNKYVYRTDISAYFNTISPEKLCLQLKQVLAEDQSLLCFLEGLLLDQTTIWNDTPIVENKGAIPGAAVSSFFANLYLNELDHIFYRSGVDYIRYSDDILVIADTEQELENHICQLKAFLSEKELHINPEKEKIYPPGAVVEFLGFSYCDGKVDVSAVSVQKIKAKIRRKTRALKRWADAKGVPSEYAAKALVKRFNQKFYCNNVFNELTWARWYFPIINTSESLEIIDRYEVECIRYLLSGTHTKKKYAYSYESVKQLGFRSLVNEYYKFKTFNDEKVISLPPVADESYKTEIHRDMDKT